jgi:curved DNA-binding protein CbpA
MTSPHDLLGISLDATPMIVKAAYHTKLREFPAHTYPTEFKAIRAAYEAIQKGATRPAEHFFKRGSIGVSIEPAAISALQQKLIIHLEVSLEDLLRDTF